MRTLDVGAAIDARPFGGFQWMVVALCGVLLIVDGYDVFVAGTAGTEPETVYLMFSPAYTRESSTVFSPVTCWFFGYTWTSRFHPVTT